MRILYVDDDPDLRDLALLGLGTDPAIEARASASGAEALEHCRTWHAELILLDVRMPGMSGEEFLRRLRDGQAGAARPLVVFATALATQEEEARLRALGCDGVLRKPFDPTALPGLVRGYLG